MINKISFLRHVLIRNNRLSYRIIKGKNQAKKITIIGMIRCRNEEIILPDTLNYLSEVVDGVIIFDDDSTDKTVEIAKGHPIVLEIIENKRWRKNQRAWEETANRKLLYDRAKKTYNPTWFLYSDADERIEGNVKEFLKSSSSKDIDGIRVRLFDSYITPLDQNDYKKGEKLFNFRRYFGVERRDILMIWRNISTVNYNFPKSDMREPHGLEASSKIITKFYCQHYGKSISIQEWENTCEYYATNFPLYAKKWDDRRGKAIHDKSDFDTELMTWKALKKHGGVKID